MQIPPQHQPPPHQPHPGSQMPHTMSPRNSHSTLQGLSTTPALSHTITSPVHPPHPSALAHSSNGLLTSPPSTPSIPSISGANRLDSGSRTFVPRRAKITVRKADGTEVLLENLAKSTLTPSTPAVSSQSLVFGRNAIQVDHDSPELVERKVKGLLNKLTMEKFSSISDQIIAWANKSEKEKDGRTLIQVIRLVFEKATDEATWSEMYARLCRKMMEQISTNIQDDGIRNAEGKPITGGQLFRKYLLNRCQEDFERGWVAKETTAVAAATKTLEDVSAKAANAKTMEGGTEGIVTYSDEYYAAQKAKRQGLGLIKFIGELFKLQMITERIMHECVKKLLGNDNSPEEEEIESLCMLLTTVGSMLDIQRARGHLDVYFSRMKEIMKSPNVTPQMQYMLQGLLELRERKWAARNAVAAHTTIAQIHEKAAKEKAAQEKESYQRQISMSRGSRRGGDRSEFSNPQQVGPDGWAVAGSGSGPPRPPPKAGDLSNFGKISKTQPMTFGPSSVFAGKKGAESKRESISRTNSSSNMFSMLSSQGAEAGDKDKVPAAAAAEPHQQRKRLVLQPRSVPVDVASPAGESESSHSEEEAGIEMTEEAAMKKINEDLKEFFAVRNLEEAEVYFGSLPPQYHHFLVDKMVSTAVELKEDDAKLVSQFFDLAASKELCSSASFEEGLTPVVEIIDDIAIDAPKAFQLLAMMVKGASLNQERLSNLASKSLNSNMFSMLSSRGAKAGDKAHATESFPQRKRQSPEFTVQGHCIDPPLAPASPSIISINSPEWLRILLNAAQEDLRLQKRQFEEEKIAMKRHFEDQQQSQRALFDAERVFYQSQIRALRGYRSGEK